MKQQLHPTLPHFAESVQQLPALAPTLNDVRETGGRH